MGGSLVKPLSSLKDIHIECDKLELLETDEADVEVEDTALELAKCKAIIKKYRYRSREVIATLLQQQADEQLGGQLIAKQNKTPIHMQPNSVRVVISISERQMHPNIDQEHSGMCTVVESKTTGQWWRMNLPFQSNHVDEIVDRATTKGMHSLLISQGSTDQAQPSKSSSFAFNPGNPGTFIKVFRAMKNALRKTKEIPDEDKYFCVRVIGQHVNPRTTDQIIVLSALPSREQPIGVWNAYHRPTPQQEHNLLQLDDNIAFALMECIQQKHEELERSCSLEQAMLTRFSAPGRLSGGNGRGTFVRTRRNHTNWIVQMIVPSEDEPFELHVRRHESASARLILARLRKTEALLHEQVKSKLPKKIQKLKIKLTKIEEKRISCVKRRQMKVAFACVEKRKKTATAIKNKEQELQQTILKLEKATLKTDHHLKLNIELGNNFDVTENALLHHGVGVVTFIGLCCDPIHSDDAKGIRESILSRAPSRKTGPSIPSENCVSSSIVRRLMQLYTPARTKRGTRKRKAGFRNGPMVCLDQIIPEEQFPPKFAHAAQYLGLWTHISLDVDSTAVDPAAIITTWHNL